MWMTLIFFLLLFIQAKAGRLTSGQLYRTDNLVTDHLAGKLYTVHPTAVSFSLTSNDLYCYGNNMCIANTDLSEGEHGNSYYNVFTCSLTHSVTETF